MAPSKTGRNCMFSTYVWIPHSESRVQPTERVWLALEGGGQPQGWAGLGKPEPRVSDSLLAGPGGTHLGGPCSTALHGALYTFDIPCMAIECGWHILNGQIQLNHFDSMMAFFFFRWIGGTWSGLAKVLCEKLWPTKICSHLMPPFYPLPWVLIWALSPKIKYLSYQSSFPLM